MSTPTRELLAALAKQVRYIALEVDNRSRAEECRCIYEKARLIADKADVPEQTETGSEAGQGIADAPASNTANAGHDNPATPAPPSPRRWLAYVHDDADASGYRGVLYDHRPTTYPFKALREIPVVEALAYDAAVRERAAWERQAYEYAGDCGEWNLKYNQVYTELANARRLTPEGFERALAAYSIKRAETLGDETAAIRAALLAARFQEVDHG